MVKGSKENEMKVALATRFRNVNEWSQIFTLFYSSRNEKWWFIDNNFEKLKRNISYLQQSFPQLKPLEDENKNVHFE